MDLEKLKRDFSYCSCGREHTFGLRAVEVGSGITLNTGAILKKNGFGQRLLLVADRNTLAAAEGIVPSLGAAGFVVRPQVYDDLRVADMKEVENIQKLLSGMGGVISVGTGSLHDVARLAAARCNKPLCLYATAPSMDGFASYNAPITDGCFKITYPAKTPEVIIADTKVLAAAPAELKSAGFGDMVGKYVGLIDWKVSHIVSGEYYCDKVAAYVREAVDGMMAMAGSVTSPDERAAAAVFEGLIKTGVAMSMVKNSRPASGTEHILSHFWECKKLAEGKRSDFHGKKVGVATLIILRKYEKFASFEDVDIVPEEIDWEEVRRGYGVLYPEVEKLNNPPVSHEIDPFVIKERWQEIRAAVKEQPSPRTVERAMLRAGCATKCSEIGVDAELERLGIRLHPHMRHRISLMRLSYMFREKK